MKSSGKRFYGRMPGNKETILQCDRTVVNYQNLTVCVARRGNTENVSRAVVLKLGGNHPRGGNEAVAGG